MAIATDDTDVYESRVKDAPSARGIYRAYLESNKKRAQAMVQTRNQIDGGRPMDPVALVKNGEDWMTNVNFRDAESAFNRTFLPYWKMVHDAPNLIAATVYSGSPHADIWGKAIAECFDLFRDDWGADYFFQFMLAANDFVKFGPGYLMWPDKDSPRAKHARTEFVLLPKAAKANVADWEVCCVEGELSISEMWGKMRNPSKSKSSKYVGWNIPMLKKAICVAKKLDGGKASDTAWAKLQDELVCNDIGLSETNQPLQIVRMFVRGYDEKIALYIFSQSDDVPDFIFKSDSYADSFSEAIGGLFYDVGSGGLVHSIKGFGIKNYYFSLLQNRMKSRMMDAATFSMSFNFQKDDDSSAESPPVENYGALNIFPKGLKQMQYYPQMGYTQGVLQVLASNAAENNYIYRDSSKAIEETQTARQAVILANLAEEIGAATASIFLSQVGQNWFAEMYRRLIKEGSTDKDAKKFVERLKARNVPVDELRKAEVKIKTGANPGTAGVALRDMIFKELLGMIRLPGMNARAIIEAYLANRLGTSAIKQFTLPEGTDSAPAQRREAMIENSLFGQGMPLPVDPADAHAEHVEEHIKPLIQIIQLANQQGGQLAPEMLVALQTSIPHVAQHFGYLKSDETQADAYKQLWPAFSQVQSIADGIFKNLQKQQQSQQQQQPNQQTQPQ